MLSIVETLKEFRNILLGHHIKVYTDHKNLTFVNFNTERVMRWRLIIKEYLPKLLYVKGETNIVADALSRLDLVTSDTSPTDMHDMQYLADNFSLEDDDLPDDAYPLQYKFIAKYQNLQKDLFVKLNKHQDGFHLKSFCGGGKKRTLICRHDKIIIPKALQRRVVTWYHNMLCHSGETRTEQTI